MKNNTIKGYFFIISSAVIYGFMPIIAKLIYADGVTPSTLVFFRAFFPAPVLFLIVKLSKEPIAIEKKTAVKVIGIGLFGTCFTPLLLFASYQFLSSGTATVFHYVYPVAVMLGSIIFLKEKANIGKILCFIVCTVGLAMFYDPAENINLKGALLALLSGIVYAAYIIMISRTKDLPISPFKFNFYVSSVTAILVFLFCILTDSLVFPKSISIWLLSIVFSVGITCSAVVLFQKGTYYIGGTKSSILSTFEPITSIIVGALLFNESIGIKTAIAMLLVLSSGIVISLIDKK